MCKLIILHWFLSPKLNPNCKWIVTTTFWNICIWQGRRNGFSSCLCTTIGIRWCSLEGQMVFKGSKVRRLLSRKIPAGLYDLHHLHDFINIWQMFNVGTDTITAKPYIQKKFISMNLLQMCKITNNKKKSDKKIRMFLSFK